MELQPLDTVLFRQRLAGLTDETELADELDFDELRSDFVLLLAIAFNRRELDAVTLWTRIENAIKKAGAEVDHDIQRFTSIALEFVLAPINVVVTVPDALDIQAKLYSLNADEQAAFICQLQTHLYPSIVFGREKWNGRKERISKLLAESEAVDE